MSITQIKFRKMNGLGNDFVVLDGRKYNFKLNKEAVFRISNRKTGIGCDQLIIIEPSDMADVTMRIFNRDGGEVESCGNASRCIGDLLFRENGTRQVTISTQGGLLSCFKAEEGMVTVDMGEPRFGWQEIPLSEPVADTEHVPLSCGVLNNPCCVNVGNPHAVFWVNHVDEIDLAEIGPKIECHSLFPQRVNISVAEVMGSNQMRIKVWERGAGLTKACGTAACAAAVAGVRTRRTQRQCKVTLPGGDLDIKWTDNNRILMTGSVTYEFEGLLPKELAEKITE